MTSKQQILRVIVRHTQTYVITAIKHSSAFYDRIAKLNAASFQYTEKAGRGVSEGRREQAERGPRSLRGESARGVRGVGGAREKRAERLLVKGRFSSDQSWIDG